MSLWIRSQDKISLIDCKGIYLVKQLNGVCHVHANYEYFEEVENYDFLGKYSTKEKAIRVLDMIQEHITKHSNNVFQMPQDEEVMIDET